MRPFWVYNIVQTDTVQNTIACRWQELRAGPLHTDSLLQFIQTNLNLIKEARIRNFQRWPVLGVYVWPNYYVGADYDDDVNYLINWLETRLNWMDENMLGNCNAVNSRQIAYDTESVRVFPNPFSESITFSFSANPNNARIEIYNSSGMLLQVEKLQNTPVHQMILADFRPGFYFYRIISNESVFSSGKIVKK